MATVAAPLGIEGGVRLALSVAAGEGVFGLIKAMALELAPHGVLVHAIAPGPIETRLISGELPLGWFGRAEEGAPSVLLLAGSPGGDLYVGQVLGPNYGDVMP